MKNFFSFFSVKKTGRKGFTIVELVIVIAVIAILAAVLIPTFSSMIENGRYSNALQTATNQLKEDALNYTAINGGRVPDDTVYEVDGYYFKVQDNALARITKEEYDALNTDIRNIIFLIPDGAGFGTYDIANALKTTTGGGVKGQATPITHDAIEGKTVEGLYLDEYMIAAADTYQYYGEADGPTDSTAAGTALLCGEKTNYVMSGVDHNANPIANILEVARLMDKSSGFVTTKCLMDATPCAGNVHVLKRPNEYISYQKDANAQYMVNGIDVLMCYGSDGGYRDKTSGAELTGYLKARDYGYATFSDLSSLNSVVNSGAKKVFSNITTEHSSEYGDNDNQANHIKYDVNATYGTDLTLMDMAKGALKVLSENIENENGFCLVIEGGAIDNACEGRKVKEGVGDYLAFDEVFGYCVNWAMNDGHTIVVACPDHDSGGFYSDPNSASAPKKANDAGTLYDTMDQVIAALKDGSMQENTVLAGEKGGHSGQNVPVWLYAPEKVRTKILINLGVPTDTDASKVRTGKFYDGTVINSSYKINNSDLSPAILSALGWTSLDKATEELFYCINKDETYGSYDPETQIFTFKNGATVKRNTTYWTDSSSVKHEFEHGYALYITNEGQAYGGSSAPKLHQDPAKPAGTWPNSFYVPRSALVEMGYLSK